MMVAEIDRRAAGDKRTRVLKNALLLAPGGKQVVRVKDVSCNGARIETKGSLQLDWDVILERDPLFVAGRVVWTRDNHAGLWFYRPLAQGEAAFFRQAADKP
ncbi:PilZ domain-containing protein [Parablastomonas sp. CN1-191]|uniref:PilZ domain-containing protein n=1 Tax=Parablastomonas sp. CN1-191 TaxID=3400908 RepID=UPI003BF87AFB